MKMRVMMMTRGGGISERRVYNLFILKLGERMVRLARDDTPYAVRQPPKGSLHISMING